MAHQNILLVNQFFEAYGKRDMEVLHAVLHDDVSWFFPGHHNFSGVKKGFTEVIHFFDVMSGIMSDSSIEADQLFMEANDQYVVEYQHICTHRADGNNMDHHWCVAWKIKNGKIIQGRHFAGDQHEVDRFFHKISQSKAAVNK
jgi:ketosteroid isomerase-like protein